MPYGSNAKVGFSATRRSVKPRHNPGEVVICDKGEIYVYGKTAAAVSIGACAINRTTGVITAGAGATADAAFAAGESGFVKVTAL